MLDRDLAILYGVERIKLREQVKRNIEVYFMVSQNAIPSI